MKPRLAYAILIFVLLVGFSLGLFLIDKPNCVEVYRKDGQASINSHKINLQITRTPGELEKGIGGKNCMPDNQGMLFNFNKSGYYPFWMKDTRFPIDIVWIDSVHQVVDVSPNVQPNSYPKTFTNSQPAETVLELSANQADKFGIKTGSYIYY